MKKKLLVGLTMGMFLVGMAGMAKADLVSVGEPFDAGSWGARLQEVGVGNFNKIEAFMLSSDDVFEPTGFQNFSNSTWTGSLVRSDYIIGTGQVTSDTQFDVHFGGEREHSLEFVFLAWEDIDLREAALCVWSGSGWTFSVYDGDIDVLDRSVDINAMNRSAQVPLPSALILLGSGLVGMIGSRLKKKNNTIS